MSNKSKNTKTNTIEDQFKKWDPKEHVLDRSGMYVGSITSDQQSMWIYNKSTNKMEQKKISYVPGLYKIFDEVLVNARDHTIRDKTCTTIKVNINKETGEISVYNNGSDGIPIVIHKEHNIYIPEMIFGVLLTSSNHENNGKIVGGKNGLGSKLTNIFSTKFTVEITDKKRNSSYYQEFSNNMCDKQEPIIKIFNKGAKIESSVKISFIPDFKRFGVDGLSDDVVSLFEKRVYDIAACGDNKIKVYLNDNLIVMDSFRDYINMFYPDTEVLNTTLVYEEQPRWKYGIIYDSVCGFKQISYVNGICTSNGGNHVNYITTQIVNGLCEKIKAKHKNINVKNAYVKDNITIFLDATIEDPDFQSQVKDELSSRTAQFGSTCNISDDFIKLFAKTGIEDEVVNFTKMKDESVLKSSDGKKGSGRKMIEKLEDARFAGTRQSKKCTLILTEGDSAKGTAISGLEVIGRDYYGVFPLKGKLLNVREATLSQLSSNEEIKNLKKILGLKQGKVYKDTTELNYGSILILTDQDTDGTHIKGLIINFIHYWWPSLLKINGFIKSMATPIIKAWKKTDKKKKNPMVFYTLTDYDNWKKVTDMSKWEIQYYKGLGTHDEKEAKECFNDFENKIINYIWSGVDNPITITNNSTNDNDNTDNNSVSSNKSSDDKTNDEDYIDDKTNENYNAITLGFAKNRINDRKIWLENYDKNNIIDYKCKNVTYHDFIHKDLIHFSNYDNNRSLPSMKDGFKPSLRKILFTCFKKNLINDKLKVAQLSGFVSALAAYHHGEMSLQGAIVGMAQNYVGANNINLLLPCGNFGNRRQGGKNHASARYIITRLCELTPLIFRKEDEPIYEYVNDDGFSAEPTTYAPILPMILINGTHGIGTGYSSSVPSFNPKDVMSNLRKMLHGRQPDALVPWYRGFTGKIKKEKDNKFRTFGIYENIDQKTIHISELPVGTWTDDYFRFLNNITRVDSKKPAKTDMIESWDHSCGTNTIDITITFLPGILQDLEKKNELIKKLKLSDIVSTTNMHLYDANDVIKKYPSIESIFVDYIVYRLDIYEKRKQYQLRHITNQLKIIKYKVLFLEYATHQKKIDLFNEVNGKRIPLKESVIMEQLVKHDFPPLSNNVDALDGDKNYNYITNMKLWSITEEEMILLTQEKDKRQKEYDNYFNKSPTNMWLDELDELEKGYDKWLISCEEDDEDDTKKKVTGKKSRKTKKTAK